MNNVAVAVVDPLCNLKLCNYVTSSSSIMQYHNCCYYAGRKSAVAGENDSNYYGCLANR